MLPSVSLNQAVLAPPAVTMLLILHAGHVVLLEGDAARLQLRDFGFHVGDLPEGLAGLRGPRIRRRVEKRRGAAAFVDHAAGVSCFGVSPITSS